MTTPSVTVLGSINMDLIALCDRAPLLGETVMGREFRTIGGGKGANQAIAAARSGARVAMIGAVGADEFGREMLQVLAREDIDISLVRRVPGSTGTAHIVVNSGGQNAIVVVPGANGSMEALTYPEQQALQRGRFLLMQLELPLPIIREAAAVARSAGVTVILTPAPAQYLPADLLQNVDWLVPNQHEAFILTGMEDAETAAAALQRKVPNVVVTLGGAGCLHLGAGSAPLSVPAPHVQAVDTTAAGDTFTGTLAVGLAEGLPRAQALQRACRAAALSVTRLGAAPSMPTRVEIDRFRP